MNPVSVNGQVWRVVRVSPGDPSLVDRTGEERLATADPRERVISVSSAVPPPLLDRVMVHEMAHAVMASYGLLEGLHGSTHPTSWVPSEEWAASLMEGYGMEAVDLASRALGRPVCVRGLCDD